MDSALRDSGELNENQQKSTTSRHTYNYIDEYFINIIRNMYLTGFYLFIKGTQRPSVKHR